MSEELLFGIPRFDKNGAELCWACTSWYLKPGQVCQVCGLTKKAFAPAPEAKAKAMIVWCCVCRQHFPENEAVALRYKGLLDHCDCPPKNEPGGRCGIEQNPNPDLRAGEIWVCENCAKVISKAYKDYT